MERHWSLKARATVIAASALAGALGLAACGSSGSGQSAASSGSGSSGASYKVSLVGDLSGPISSEGATGIAGFQAAIDNINAGGGVDGHKIVMASPIDTQSTTTGAVAGFRQALGQSPLAILASLDPGEEQSAASLLNGAQLPVLSVTETDTLEGTPPEPWAFTANLTSAESAASYTQYVSTAVGGLTGKKIAIVAYNNAGPIGYMNSIAADVKKAGGSVVAEDLTEANTTSFAPQAAKIVSQDPAAVVSIDVSTNTVLEVSALKAAGFKGVIAGGPAVQDPTLLRKIAAVDPEFAAPLTVEAPTPNDLMSTTAAKYNLSSQAQSVFFSGGWSLAYALAGALKKCGSGCTSSALITALETAGPYQVPGNVLPTAPTFSKTNHVLITSVQFTRWDPTTKKVVSAGPLISLG